VTSIVLWQRSSGLGHNQIVTFGVVMLLSKKSCALVTGGSNCPVAEAGWVESRSKELHPD